MRLRSFQIIWAFALCILHTSHLSDVCIHPLGNSFWQAHACWWSFCCFLALLSLCTSLVWLVNCQFKLANPCWPVWLQLKMLSLACKCPGHMVFDAICRAILKICNLRYLHSIINPILEIINVIKDIHIASCNNMETLIYERLLGCFLPSSTSSSCATVKVIIPMNYSFFSFLLKKTGAVFWFIYITQLLSQLSFNLCHYMLFLRSPS